MLRVLLEKAAGRGSRSIAELASDLGVSVEMTSYMLDELCRLGYLKSVVPGCQDPCEGCPVGACCTNRESPRMWTLTESGSMLLAGGD